MKQLIAIFVFIAILLQTYSKVVVVAQFYANQDYIAKNLCENKDKPTMHCNGKCHLKKQLEKQEQPFSPNIKDKQDMTLFCAYQNVTVMHGFVDVLSSAHTYYRVPATASYTASIFHPPASGIS